MKEISKLRVLTDDQLRIQKASSATSVLTGYDQEDLVGLHLGQFTDETYRRRLIQAGTLALMGRPQRVSVALATADGTSVSLLTSTRTVMREGQRCLLWSFESLATESVEHVH